MSDDYHYNYKELISKIKRLTSKEKKHILSIFKKYNVEFTKNSNGYFFNLDKIDSSIIDKISKCADLIEQKRELIYNLDKKRDAHLEYYKSLIENKLKETINIKRSEYINQLILIPSDTYIKKKKKRYLRVVINEDPDVLMKEYLKSKKYKKDSVYYRISQQLTLMGRKFRTTHKNIDRDDGGGGDYNDGTIGGDDEGGADLGDEYEDLGEDLPEDLDDNIDNEFSKDNDDDDNVDESGDTSDEINPYNKTEDDVDDDEYYKDSDDDSDIDTTNDKTDKTEKSEKTTKTGKTVKSKNKKKKKNQKESVEASSFELDYYKQLLKQSGFKFDDDKLVIMKKEEYIN